MEENTIIKMKLMNKNTFTPCQKEILREAESAPPQNAVKMLTRAIYEHSEMLADQVDLIYRKCEELGKQVPAEIRQKLDAIKSAGLDYVRLVDAMTDAYKNKNG